MGRPGLIVFQVLAKRARVERPLCKPDAPAMYKTLDTPTVLIVDEDLGFIFWLRDIVTEAGCLCIPALNSLQAISFVRELKVEIDLLIVKPSLAGVSEMIQTLNNAHIHSRLSPASTGLG